MSWYKMGSSLARDEIFSRAWNDVYCTFRLQFLIKTTIKLTKTSMLSPSHKDTKRAPS